MSAFRRSSGQATVLTILFLAVLLAMLGAVLDVGSWFRSDRALQATADAAALAGAQALPDNPGQAQAFALDYAGKNGGGVGGGAVQISSTYVPNDTIKVTGERSADGVFTSLFGIDSVQVHGAAKARSGTLSSAKYVAPIVVNWKHSMLSCTPPPCTGATQIDLMNLHQAGSGNAAGAFGLINLNQNGGNGNVGAPILAQWMQQGFQDAMELGSYYQVPSAEFNNVQFKKALNLRLNTEVLFPIYKTLSGSGSNAQYQIIGWVGFVPTSFTASGNSGTVNGSFKRVIWAGLPSTSPSQQAFGAYAVQLIE